MFLGIGKSSGEKVARCIGGALADETSRAPAEMSLLVRCPSHVNAVRVGGFLGSLHRYPHLLDLRDRPHGFPADLPPLSSFRSSSLMLARTKTVPWTLSSLRRLYNTATTSPPAGIIDSHMHFLDETKFPLSKDRKYTPHPAPFEEGVAHLLKKHHIDRLCLVQPSVYGTNNDCVIDGIERLGLDKACGVAVIDSGTITTPELEQLDREGIRGVRVNLKSVNANPSPEELEKMLRKHADLIRPFDWVLQIYAELKTLTHLHNIIPTHGLKVCLDHFACAQGPSRSTSQDPYQQEGYPEFVSLLQSCKSTYVKISGAYRLSDDKDPNQDMSIIGRELLRIAPDQCVWASDWPHTSSVNPNIPAHVPQPGREVDLQNWMQTCIEWCDGDSTLVDKLFVRNALRLWKWS